METESILRCRKATNPGRKKLLASMEQRGGHIRRLNAEVDAGLHAGFKGRVAERGETTKEALGSLMEQYLTQ